LALSMTRRAFVLGAAMAPLLARRTIAQAAFPSRPIRIVIGFPPGGGIDILARLIAPKMSERLVQPVVVENRPGANGLIATQGVAQSEPDGHTILFGTTGNLAVNPVLYAGRPGMNMERDFMPLSHVASLAFVLAVNPSVPAKSLKELIDLAKARPAEILYGSSGNGGLPHLSGELLNLQAAITTRHVPYRGSAPAFTDLISGQVQFVFDAFAIAQPHIDAGPAARARDDGTKANVSLARCAGSEGDAAELRSGELVRHGRARRHARRDRLPPEPGGSFRSIRAGKGGWPNWGSSSFGTVVLGGLLCGGCPIWGNVAIDRAVPHPDRLRDLPVARHQQTLARSGARCGRARACRW